MLAVLAGVASSASAGQLTVTIRSAEDRSAIDVRSVHIDDGRERTECTPVAGGFSCAFQTELNWPPTLTVEVEPVTGAALLPREVALQVANWGTSKPRTLTLHLARRIKEVPIEVVIRAATYLDPPGETPDRALALLEAIGEWVRELGNRVPEVTHVSYLYNRGRALQNLCINKGYETCDAAAEFLRQAEAKQRGNPAALGVRVVGFAAGHVRSALAALSTFRRQQKELALDAIWKRATESFREEKYCDAATQFSALVDDYTQEAREWRSLGVFYFYATYQHGLATCRCGLNLLRASDATGCRHLRSALTTLGTVLHLVDGEAMPPDKQFLWEMHLEEVKRNIPNDRSLIATKLATSCEP